MLDGVLLREGDPKTRVGAEVKLVRFVDGELVGPMVELAAGRIVEGAGLGMEVGFKVPGVCAVGEVKKLNGVW
jgi:hypothetical protein